MTLLLDCVWNVMAHAQKPDFVFRRNGRVHLNRQGRQFNRLLAAEVCASPVVMLDTPCSEVMWRVLATHSIRQFSLHFPSQCVTVCHHISTGLLTILTRPCPSNQSWARWNQSRPSQGAYPPTESSRVQSDSRVRGGGGGGTMTDSAWIQ